MLSDGDRQLVEQYFRDWWDAVRLGIEAGLRAAEWKQTLPAPPIAALQAAALHHPNARVRRDCLNVLDHDANDESTDVFLAALGDPVPKVRVIAVHAISCERCRVGALCVGDVVPVLADVLAGDDSAKVRHAALFVLHTLADRDEQAREAIRRAAIGDPDELVRRAACAARDGRFGRMGSRKAIRRRDRRVAAAS